MRRLLPILSCVLLLVPASGWATSSLPDDPLDPAQLAPPVPAALGLQLDLPAPTSELTWRDAPDIAFLLFLLPSLEELLAGNGNGPITIPPEPTGGGSGDTGENPPVPEPGTALLLGLGLGALALSRRR